MKGIRMYAAAAVVATAVTVLTATATQTATATASSQPAAQTSASTNPFANPLLTDTSPIKVAAVDAYSKKYDLQAGLTEADRIVKEAKGQGAALVAFPELWLPGFANADPNQPFSTPPADFSAYVRNSIQQGDASWKELLQIAKKNGVYLEMGFSEKTPATNHLYMTTVIAGPDGKVLSIHRKLRPSGGERAFFSDSPITAASFPVVNTAIGRIGTLSCAENWRPEMTFNTMAQAENLHLIPWAYVTPDGQNEPWWPAHVGMTSAEYYARSSGAWTVFAGAGHSAIYDGSGQIQAEATPAQADFSIATVDRKPFKNVQWQNSTFDYNYSGLKLIEHSYPLAKGPQQREVLNTPNYTQIK